MRQVEPTKYPLARGQFDGESAQQIVRAHVLAHEQQFWQRPLAEGVFDAAIDTTMALYRPLSEVSYPDGSALRTGPPYVADHLAWYENLDDLPDELSWYYEHIEPGIAFWTAAGKSCWGD